MKVRFLGESNPLQLLNGKIYPVESIEFSRYRIIDETDEDYLYPIAAFEIVEAYPEAPVLLPDTPKPPNME